MATQDGSLGLVRNGQLGQVPGLIHRVGELDGVVDGGQEASCGVGQVG